MSDFYVSVGQKVTFRKTISESDVYLFAGITGDLSPNHVDQVYMEKSSYGTRMVHGALLVGLMSTVSSVAISHTRDSNETPVALGFDRVRFIKPVFLGDTVELSYEFMQIDLDKKRTCADIKVTNQHGTLVAVATHILKWVENN